MIRRRHWTAILAQGAKIIDAKRRARGETMPSDGPKDGDTRIVNGVREFRYGGRWRKWGSRNRFRRPTNGKAHVGV